MTPPDRGSCVGPLPFLVQVKATYHATVTGWSHSDEGRPNGPCPDSLKSAAAVTSFPALIDIGDALVTNQLYRLCDVRVFT